MRRLLRWLFREPAREQYFPEQIEQHLRELGLSPYPPERLQNGR